MKRALIVLALAMLSSAGCRTMGSRGGQQCGGPCGQPCCQPCQQPCCDPCGQPCDPNCCQECGDACCDECCESCHMMTHQYAPRPEGCDDACCHGNIEQHCPGGNCYVFDRYRGQSRSCGCSCPGPEAYDCSPCGSPDWGCTGYRHPHGYVSNQRCICENQPCCPPGCTPCPHCGRGYCGGTPGPGCGVCNVCGCGPSGDHNYDFNPGPPVAQTAYPYYTLRGPRDFLLDNPPSIGPY